MEPQMQAGQSFGAAVLLHVGGHVLLQKRTHDAPRHPDKWTVFGGKGEPGETPEAAAVREVGEELGLRLDPAALRPVISIPMYVRGVPAYAHYFSTPLGPPLSELQLNEGAGFALFSKEEISDQPVVAHAKLALHQFFVALRRR